jgi:hypothetical protein
MAVTYSLLYCDSVSIRTNYQSLKSAYAESIKDYVMLVKLDTDTLAWLVDVCIIKQAHMSGFMI